MMPTPAAALKAIASAFKDGWDAGATSAGVLVLWPDQRFDAPADETPFARLTVQHAASGGQTHGPNPLFWRTGVIVVQCFGQETRHASAPQTAQDHAYELANDALSGFEGVAVAGVHFRNSRLVDVGPDGRRYQVNAVIDFAYTQQRAA